MKRKTHISIVLPKMNINGIQRVHMLLADEFCERGFNVDLIVGQKKTELSSELNKNVRLISLSHNGGIFFLLNLFLYILKVRPTHIISPYEDVSAFIVLIKKIFAKDLFVLLGIHNSFKGLLNEKTLLTKLKYKSILLIMPFFYKHADSVIAVSSGLADETKKTLKLDNVNIIYNPVISKKFNQFLAEQPPTALANLHEKVVIGYFGRLKPQKNLSYLIKTFSTLYKKLDAYLLIVGEGEEKESLKDLAVKLDVEDRIIFHDFLINPFPCMKLCNVVVLSSLYEGLGNVLIEAMAAGIPVISTNCPHGPSEILDDGRWGTLVEINNIDELASAIEKTINKEYYICPTDLKARAYQFSTATSAQQYLQHMGLVDS